MVVKENFFRRFAPSLLLSILGGFLLHAIDRPAPLTSNDLGNPLNNPTTSSQNSNSVLSNSQSNTQPNPQDTSIPSSKPTKGPGVPDKPNPQKTTPNKSPNPTPAKSSTPTPLPTKSSTPTPLPTKSSTPTPLPTQSQQSTGFTGKISGDAADARNYGRLTATVTFKNGKIENVSAFQSPSSWSQNSLPSLIDYVNTNKITIEQIKQISSEKLPCSISNSCKSQASFTANAFWLSVKSAIVKAGL